MALIRAMFDRGHARRLLIGNDLGRPSYWRAYGGGPGLDYVLTRFVPKLHAAGFTQADVDLLLVDNPRRFLAGEA